MTGGVIDTHYPIHVSPEGLRRVLDLSRRALRARDVWVMSPDYTPPYKTSASQASSDDPGADADHGDSPYESVLVAPVIQNDIVVASLVATDVPGRPWSDDDRAMLADLAAILAAEVRPRGATLGGTAERAAAGPEAPLLHDPGATAVVPSTSNPVSADSITPDEEQVDDALRILLADDLDLNRKLICDMLSIDGYVCDSVADGAAAVEAVKCKTYDLVLMDMIMPGMDGMEATRAIRALPSPLCDVPIVALTAHSFREQLDNCLRAGMNATLTKPMSFDSLSAAVNTWARHRQAA